MRSAAFDCTGNVKLMRQALESAHRGWGEPITAVPKIVDWYMEGKIQIDPMIAHTMPMEYINKGFDLMNQGNSIRSVVAY